MRENKHTWLHVKSGFKYANQSAQKERHYKCEKMYRGLETMGNFHVPPFHEFSKDSQNEDLFPVPGEEACAHIQSSRSLTTKPWTSHFVYSVLTPKMVRSDPFHQAVQKIKYDYTLRLPLQKTSTWLLVWLSLAMSQEKTKTRFKYWF